MRDNYTESAAQVQKLAQKSAKVCGHSYVGSEHLLIGLIQEEKGTAGVILRAHHVSEEKLKLLIDQLIAPQSDAVLEEREGWTPRAEEILRDSAEIARFLDGQEIGTEHILIAILRDVECVAARLLHTLGVNLQKLYMDLATVMGLPEDKYKDLVKNARSDGAGSTPMLDQ